MAPRDDRKVFEAHKNALTFALNADCVSVKEWLHTLVARRTCDC